MSHFDRKWKGLFWRTSGDFKVDQLVNSPLLCRLNYLNNYWWIAVKFCTYIYSSPRKKPADFGEPPDFTSGTNMCGFEWNVSTSIRRSPWNSVQTSMSPAGCLAITLVMLQLSAVQYHGVWLNACKANDISFYITTIPASKLHVSIRC